MRTNLVLLAIFAAVLAPSLMRAEWQIAAADMAPAEERPRLVAATFRSSWCGACLVLEPRLDDVQREYEDAAVEFIRFDFTLGRRDALRDRAEAAGIAGLYDQLEGRTGFMVLMDRETGDVYEMVTMSYEREHIRAALDRWISVVEYRDS